MKAVGGHARITTHKAFFVALGAASVGLVALAGACSPANNATATAGETNLCSAKQALTADAFDGKSLAPKQVALTFDDGPGSRTLELSAYLKAEGIRAAFFVNGHCFGPTRPCGTLPTDAADVLTQIVADGHIVANHTQEHRDLTGGYFPADPTGDAALVRAVADTDAIIAPYVPANRFLFRPPYGAWNGRNYDVLEASPMQKYYGPVRWDVGGKMTGTDATGFGADWDCWQNQTGFGLKSTSVCASRYMNEVAAVGRGIVLLHDSDCGNMANRDLNVGAGNTIDMTKVLVSMLKAQGYSFVRLDEVPALAAVLPPLPPQPVSDAGAGADATDGNAADAGLADAGEPSERRDAGTTPPASIPPTESSNEEAARQPADDPCAETAGGASAPARQSLSRAELPYSTSAH